MSKSRRERRRQRAQTEARRLHRFERTLVGVIPPKGVVGPVERLWRVGKIGPTMFWAATRYASCFEATLPDSILQARSFECGAGPLVSIDRRLAERSRLGRLYIDARSAMVGSVEPETAAVLLAAAAQKIAFELIDDTLRKRKSWARETTIDGLEFLIFHWSIDLQRAWEQAEHEGHPLV